MNRIGRNFFSVSIDFTKAGVILAMDRGLLCTVFHMFDCWKWTLSFKFIQQLGNSRSIALPRDK
jgi:hypothetical protein